MNELQISCIIPCYNSQKYIAKTITSVLNQTVKPLEIILVDDKSTDNTLQMLKKVKSVNENLIKVIELQENKGSSFARNYGVKIASGEYVLFMDSDDIADPKLLEKYVNRLETLNKSNLLFQLCYSGYVQIDQDDNIISSVIKGFQCDPIEILGYQFVRNSISTSGVIVHKDLFLETGGFNENLRYAEDWDLWLRLAAKTGFAYVDEPLVKIRRHGDNLSAKVNLMLQAEKEILKQYDKSYIKNAIFRRKLTYEQNMVDYVALLFRLDDWEEGFIELKNLMEKGYRFYNLYFYLGLYYLHHYQLDNALTYFTKTITYKHNHGAALNNAGAIFLLKGKQKEAEKCLHAAIDYFPNYIDANHNLKYLNDDSVTIESLNFTWRELREVLTSYR